jgi:1-deoxy-D-xylulose-5-phosphate reductoisomerase
VAVDAFHEGRLRFDQIVELIERVVDAHEPEAQLTLESVLEAERWARDRAAAQIATAC